MSLPLNHGSNFQSIASLSVALNVGLSALFAFSENNIPAYLDLIDKAEIFVSDIDNDVTDKIISDQIVHVISECLILRGKMKAHHNMVIKGSLLIRSICAICALVGMLGLIDVTLYYEAVSEIWEYLIILSCAPVILLSLIYTLNSIVVNIIYDKRASAIEESVTFIASAVRDRRLYRKRAEV